MERGTGATGRDAASLVGMETKSEHARAATLARPLSPEPATCPPAQVSPGTTFHTCEDDLVDKDFNVIIESTLLLSLRRY